MSEPIVITLPLPAPQLSPNSRGHWAKKARAVKKHRQIGHLAASLELMSDHWLYRKWTPLTTAEAQATFYVRDNRRRDADNHLAMCKPYFDGMVDAGLLADDSGLRHSPVEFVVDKKDPRVEITIRPLAPQPPVQRCQT